MENVPEVFLRDIFGYSRSGKGKVIIEKSRQDRTDDVKLAKYLKRKFGGEYVVLSDIAPQGVKVPDLLLTNRAIIENKKVSSLKSLDSQTRKALAQLDRMNLSKLRDGLDDMKLRHVLIVQINSADFDCDFDVMVGVIMHRINRYKSKRIPYLDYVIFRRNGRIVFIWKTSKAP